MKLTIDVDARGAVAGLREFPRAMSRATASAVNKVAKSALAAASSQIRQDYNIRKKDLDPFLKLERTSERAGRESGVYEARIVARGTRIPLVLFSARQTKQGVTVHIRRRSGRVLLKGKFIAEKNVSRPGAFGRRIVGGVRVARLPIRTLVGPGVPEMFGTEAVIRSIRDKVAEQWPKVFAHEFEFYASGSAPERRNAR